MRSILTIITEGTDMETISETNSMVSSINEKSVSAVVEVVLAFSKGTGYPYFTNFLFQLKRKNLTPNSSTFSLDFGNR